MKINYHKIITDLENLKLEISYDRKVLLEHSTDASIFKVVPEVIVYPRDKHDISKVVKYVQTFTPPDGTGDKLSVTARAAGTCMSGGSLNDSIIIDVTKYLNKIEKIDYESVVCEPGIYYRDLEKQMDKLNVFYPSYPASKDLCCVGGIVANNSSGEKTLTYGSTKDWVREIEMVLEDGSIFNFKEISIDDIEKIQNPLAKEIHLNILELVYKNEKLIDEQKPKVSKNSSGYFLWDVIDKNKKTINLSKLICGSQGTFGIITKVKLGLVPKKKYSQMLTIFLPDLEKLVPVVQEVLADKNNLPESLESYDDHTFTIAMKFLPTIIWKLKGSIFQLAWSFIPEAWMVLTGGVPKLIIMAEYTGNTQAKADKKVEIAFELIKHFGLKQIKTENEIDISKYWLFRRESFNLLRSRLKDLRTAPFIEDVIIPIDKMSEFIPKMQNILDKNKFTYTIAGHAGNGNFHIIPLMKLNSNEEVELIKETNEKVFTLVEKYKGSISAEHNDGLVRTPYLHFMFSAKMRSIFADTKKIFDQHNIFNPGKKVGGGIEENYSKINLTK